MTENIAMRLGKLQAGVELLLQQVEKINPCHNASDGKFCSTGGRGGSGGGGRAGSSEGKSRTIANLKAETESLADRAQKLTAKARKSNASKDYNRAADVHAEVGGKYANLAAMTPKRSKADKKAAQDYESLADTHMGYATLFSRRARTASK